jgi:hypothetical protein
LDGGYNVSVSAMCSCRRRSRICHWNILACFKSDAICCVRLPGVNISLTTSNSSTELALQQIEAQSGIRLSRILGSPNITSKGPIRPFTARLRAQLYPQGHPFLSQLASTPSKPLIEDVTETRTQYPTKGILRNAAADMSSAEEIPSWTWTQEGGRLRLELNVPKLVSPISTCLALPILFHRFVRYLTAPFACIGGSMRRCQKSSLRRCWSTSTTISTWRYPCMCWADFPI